MKEVPLLTCSADGHSKTVPNCEISLEYFMITSRVLQCRNIVTLIVVSLVMDFLCNLTV